MEQDIKELSLEELLAFAEMQEDKEILREIATLVGATFSGNTGVTKLKESIVEFAPVYFAAKEEEENKPDLSNPVVQALLKDPPVVVEASDPTPRSTMPNRATLLMMDEFAERNPIIKRAIVRAKALRLIRCKITNMDPNDSEVPSMILTVYNKYTGKVSKLIPFGDENEHGYHIPKILFDELNTRTYNMRKEIKTPGSTFGIKQYKTVKMKKFHLEILPNLTPEELKSLADRQNAAGAIDQS